MWASSPKTSNVWLSTTAYVSQWNLAFKKKYGKDEWEMIGDIALSKYTDKVYDVHTEYFRVVVEDGKEKVRNMVMKYEIQRAKGT